MLALLPLGMSISHLFNFAGAKNSRGAPAKLNGVKKMTNKKTQYLDYRKATFPFEARGEGARQKARQNFLNKTLFSFRPEPSREIRTEW